ncbi:DUF4876 domain-containing protein [Prolixibacter sp. SD074]|uniref:DUF4876 domain-containing protein n=1 Tax=Prolixibacter sp. SD074 TaxID=2652391 RepID=UPI00126DB005|nr:DUF4876 domain-containing protein [Prolixibacter sp. SD074]GET30251.1 DUF4876 domain-containing protein [Prolixibacter sp. SD074]
MRRLKTIGLLLIWTVTLLTGCRDDKFNVEPQLYDVSVQLSLPDSYSGASPENTTVRLINIDNQLESEGVTGANGQCTFHRVTAGKYRLWAGKKYPAAEARSLGSSLVTDRDILQNRYVSLNYNQADITVTGNTDLGSKTLKENLAGLLVIKELYYTGSRTPNGKAYWSDQFVEIFNNSDETIYLDSLYIASVYGASGNSTAAAPSPYAGVQDSVFLDFVRMIPGTGKDHPLKPGKSIVIAQDGMNHRDDPNGNPTSIDLSHADWETFLYRPENQKDIDFAEVPNLTEIFASMQSTFDWIFNSYGAGIVIYRNYHQDEVHFVPRPNDTKGRTLMSIPSEWVLDGVEALASADAGAYHRIPYSIDAGFTYCNGNFNLQSCRRKIEQEQDGRIILTDTNNSSEDFDVILFPTPGTFN